MLRSCRLSGPGASPPLTNSRQCLEEISATGNEEYSPWAKFRTTLWRLLYSFHDPSRSHVPDRMQIRINRYIGIPGIVGISPDRKRISAAFSPAGVRSASPAPVSANPAPSRHQEGRRLRLKMPRFSGALSSRTAEFPRRNTKPGVCSGPADTHDNRSSPMTLAVFGSMDRSGRHLFSTATSRATFPFPTRCS